MKKLILGVLFFCCSYLLADSEAEAEAETETKVQPHEVTSLKVTTLSTMLASRGIGEWGYAALIEVDNKKILFDTGNRPETVLQNAIELGIDLSDVEDVILSHNHGDHTGGLVNLRKILSKNNPNALKRVHVGRGIFSRRANSNNRMLEMKKELEALGVEFIIYDKVHELYPGVWLTGPIKRIHPERNWSGRGKIMTDKGLIEDNIPEDLSLVIDTAKGFVLISGCGHAGIINTMEHIVLNIHPGEISTAIGGFHLVSATDQHLQWTAKQMQSFGVSKMIGAHCTGIDSLYTIRKLLKSDRKHIVVGSIGDQFELDKGITAGFIAH